MKKIFSLLIVGMGLFQCTMAQDSGGGGFDKSKLFVGGALGLAFDSYTTIVNVSPLVGYHFTPAFAAGAGINYSYYRYDNGLYTSKQTYAGMSLFGRVYPIPQLFIQVQPELNYMWASQTADAGQQYSPYKTNQFVPSLLLGGGAAIPTSANGALTISVMYDVLQNIWSPYYHTAVYGVGYNFGF